MAIFLAVTKIEAQTTTPTNTSSSTHRDQAIDGTSTRTNNANGDNSQTPSKAGTDQFGSQGVNTATPAMQPKTTKKRAKPSTNTTPSTGTK